MVDMSLNESQVKGVSPGIFFEKCLSIFDSTLHLSSVKIFTKAVF